MARHTKRVAITGANGFTGLALTSRLRAQNYEVRGFGLGQDTSWGVDGDLNNEDALRKFFSDFSPDAVVHLAGIASPVHGSITQIYEANVEGTTTLLQALEHSRSTPQIVIVASSATVYAETAGTQILVESDRLEPRTHYGVSKLTVEHICRLFSVKLNIQVVRPFNYTGPGQSTNFLIPKIVKHFVDDAGIIELGNLNLKRDISDLRDVVECYARLIEKSGGPTLNICSGKAVKLASIVELLCEISGKSMSVKTNNSLVRGNEPYSICGSTRALHNLIGNWVLRDLRETLFWMYHQQLNA